ncbi:MAG TPA: redoxin domain-containing protein [Gemmatimonadales bacterium]|nr:redoxin domain-containing protein [Gemmatimonadales bacterium]
MTWFARSLTLAVAICGLTSLGVAQGPAVGDTAPDWRLPMATMAGVGDSLALSSLRGKTVVLAFFPKARTSGCTIQMRAYRDRFTELFGGGDDVVLIAISKDTPADLASWAADEKFPFRFAADVDGVAGKAYGTLAEGRQWESRVLFVVGPTGTVQTVMRPFREIDPTAYDELKAAVRAAR